MKEDKKTQSKLFEISDIYSLSNGIIRKENYLLIASGRVGLNYEDFSKKINKKYLLNYFKKYFQMKYFNFQIYQDRIY